MDETRGATTDAAGWVISEPPPFAPCDLCDRWADGLLDGRPMCLGCVERTLDRVEAVAASPALQATLPGLEEWVPGG